jgi:tripartite motif-containing protein 2/3
VDDNKKDLQRRRQEMQELSTRQTHLIDHMEKDEDCDNEHLLQELSVVSTAIGGHRREIQRLEGLVMIEVGVTEIKLEERVVLVAGKMTRVPGLSDGSIVWIPPSYVDEVALTKSTDITVVQRMLPVAHSVQGTLVQQWGARGRGWGEFIDPSNVATYGGLCLVSDYGNDRIQVFTLNGTFLRQWTTGLLSRPKSSAVNEKGEVFVNCCSNTVQDDRIDNRIMVFALDGTFLREWKLGVAFTQTKLGIAVNATSGYIYVARGQDGCVAVYRPDGSYVKDIGVKGNDEGELLNAVDVVVHGDEVLVCDRLNDQIKVFGLDGEFLRAWGEELDEPCGLAVTEAGEVIVCDEGNYRIQVFRLDGSFVRKWDVVQPVSVAVSGDKILVCSPEDHLVEVFV